MNTRTLALGALILVSLTGCFNPTKPEIDTADPSLPFDKAMDAVIAKDNFLAANLRPGFYRAEDGAVESYVAGTDETGGPALEHLANLSRKWCTQNGGKVSAFPELPVLERGVGTVIQLRENVPVVGHAYNLICFRNRQAIAAAVIGRDNFFMNTTQFRLAVQDAGASIMRLQPSE